MKKTITAFSIIIMMCLAFVLTVGMQQGKEKQQQGNSKNQKNKNGNNDQGKDQKDKINQGNNGQKDKDRGNNDQEKGNKDNRGNDKVKGNKGNNEDDNDGKGKKLKNKDQQYYNSVYGYNWDNDNFKNRRDYRKQEKVSICHKISNDKVGVNINVSENAVKAHLNHGDIIGDCPAVEDRRYSDIFYNNRNDYYNTLQNTQEQVYYSQSILEYALVKLTNGRSQLSTLQRNNAPAEVIQTNQQNIVQLEQNVSLLESLIGVAVNVVANKLQ